MEKRLLLALVLSVGVVLVFSHFTQPPPESDVEEEVAADTETIQSAPTETTSTDRDQNDVTPPDFASEASTGVSVSSERVVSEAGETVPFSTNKLRGTFNRRGGAFQSIQLKDYDKLDRPSESVDLVSSEGKGFLFDRSYPESTHASASYELIESEDTQTYTFRHTADSVAVTKQYRFLSDPYRARLKVTVANRAPSSRRLENMDFPVGQQGQAGVGIRWGPGFGVDRSGSSRLDQVYVYFGKNGEMNYLSPGGGGMMSWITGGDEDDSPYQFKRGPIEWTSISSRYFAATIIPQTRADMMFVNTEHGADTFTAWTGQAPFSLDAGNSRVFEYDLYLGPKEYDVLQEVYPGLEATLNYGWFTFLARPLLWSLNWIYALIPNYGIAIIVLSILIKVALYPLTKKGLTSMQKMKELQPELQELQDKYSDDKEKLNQKMMEFYQEHELNPLGGCLPMLLQLPIFIGLYRMLEYSIELRGAPFMLWVTDLSSKDPYYILPVVMGIVMFFQQKYTMTASAMGGSTGQQQKMMMYFMPVMFVFLFMNFPVGLVLYWMTNSLVTLIQYALINRSLEAAD